MYREPFYKYNFYNSKRPRRVKYLEFVSAFAVTFAGLVLALNLKGRIQLRTSTLLIYLIDITIGQNSTARAMTLAGLVAVALVLAKVVLFTLEVNAA